MNIILLILFIIVSLTSCEGPDLKRIKNTFNQNIEKFELLGKMAKDDFQGRICFTIGLDHIGDYWKDTDEKWYKRNQYEIKLSLSQVLHKLKISEERYKKYKTFFVKTGTERVTYCERSDTYSFLAYRAGLAVSGCHVDINKDHKIPNSKGKPGAGDFTEIIPLKNHWYMEYSCT